MPDTYIRFSDLKDSHPSPIDGANDLLAIAHKDTQSPTGYNSMSVTPNALGAHAVEDQSFVNLHTTAKTIEGAINEIADNASSHTYSTTEQVVGTWYNGETIYEKTLEAVVTSSSYTVDIRDLNIAKVVRIEGFIEQTSGNTVPVPYCTTSSDFAICYYNGGYLKFSYSGAYNTTTWYITIQYTKSTS